MRPSQLLVPMALALLVVVASPAAAQSRCADCHFANPDAPGQQHINDWEHSEHGRQKVGCERCHGGDATTFERGLAHRDMIPSANPKSPANRVNLPVTCGTCHAVQLGEFQKTRHYQLLKGNDRRGPTCSTCHTDVGASTLSPKGLESQCNACHGPGKTAPRPERASHAREMLQGVVESRALLKEARNLIKRVSEPHRRATLTQDASLVQAELVYAVQAGHTFVYDGLENRLTRARTMLAALFNALANPASPGKPVKGVVTLPHGTEAHR